MSSILKIPSTSQVTSSPVQNSGMPPARLPRYSFFVRSSALLIVADIMPTATPELFTLQNIETASAYAATFTFGGRTVMATEWICTRLTPPITASIQCSIASCESWTSATYRSTNRLSAQRPSWFSASDDIGRRIRDRSNRKCNSPLIW